MSKKNDNLRTWESIYNQGHAQRYPWDIVVSFIYRYYPKEKERKDVKILEVGFGTGSNLWFAAREGFSVYGVEGSPSAVEYARKRFEDEGLEGSLEVGDFRKLPFGDNFFDLVIDRGALSCVSIADQQKAIIDIQRVMKVGGKFLYNGYADSHTGARSGEYKGYGLTGNIETGTLVGIGDICFISRRDINELFSLGWQLKQVQRREWVEMLGSTSDIHAEWVVVAEKAD